MSFDGKSDADLARRFAMQIVEDRLRELAANILRTIRGTGNPHTILSEAQALIDATLSYREQVGEFPAPDKIGKALDIDAPDERLNHVSPEAEAVVTARNRIIHGALQVAASRMVEQRPQEAADNTELREGIDALRAATEERRKRKPKSRLEQILDPDNPEFPDAGTISFERAAAQLEAILEAGVPVSQRIFIAIFPFINPGYMIKQWMKRGELPAAKVKRRWILSEDYCRRLIRTWRNDPLNIEKRTQADRAEKLERPPRRSPKTRR